MKARIKKYTRWSTHKIWRMNLLKISNLYRWQVELMTREVLVRIVNRVLTIWKKKRWHKLFLSNLRSLYKNQKCNQHHLLRQFNHQKRCHRWLFQNLKSLNHLKLKPEKITIWKRFRYNNKIRNVSFLYMRRPKNRNPSWSTLGRKRLPELTKRIVGEGKSVNFTIRKEKNKNSKKLCKSRCSR